MPKTGKTLTSENFFSRFRCAVQLGPKLLPNGSNLGPNCGMLDPSWGEEVGALLAKVGLKLSPCCGRVGSKPWIWTNWRRYAKGANYQRPACAVRNAFPPAEAVAVEQIVHSYHPLLNYHTYHTSAPSVRADFFGWSETKRGHRNITVCCSWWCHWLVAIPGQESVDQGTCQYNIGKSRKSRNDDALQNQHRVFEQVPKMLESSRLASKWLNNNLVSNPGK